MKTSFFSVFLLAALIAAMFGAGQPVRAVSASNAFPADTERAQTQALDPASLLNPDGTLDLTSNPHGVFDLRGWDVTLDALRGPILTPRASAPAAPDTLMWTPLARNGLNNFVTALAVSGGDLYVGGDFTQTADGTMTLNHIAKYSGGAWSSLANNGLNGGVRALAVSGSDLYVGGTFTRTGDNGTTLNRIAKYSGGAWMPLANQGLNNFVAALAVSGGDVYVGGDFTKTGDVTMTLNRIAKYSGGAWSALPNKGLNGRVYALAVSGSDLYVGGEFTETDDGVVTNLRCIAKFSGGAWSALANGGLKSPVRVLAVSGSDLYVGGAFTETADGVVKDLNYIAKYSGGAWSALSNDGLNNEVYALAVSGSDLYVGGWFTRTADGNVRNLNYVAKYSGGAWSPLANQGLSAYVEALAVSGSDLYVGGEFTKTGDRTMTLNSIAKLTTTSASVATFRSAGAQDGWVLESGENTNKGGTLDANATTFRLGDDAARKQYRAILSFNTSGLPDNAVITKVTLKVKRQGVTGGGNPVNTFQGFLADVKKGAFGTSALQITDYQTAANMTLGPDSPTPISGWYTLDLTSTGNFVNKLASNGGLTQIRLRFSLDDNNNAAANYLSLFSGNAPLASRPQLIVEYYIP
ncbi:MAG: DNRLRE domain-containing protein [Chloroflexi bacterium]|nr:DNRLRE domain-containing protein [Chloroflexota bacterium]